MSEAATLALPVAHEFTHPASARSHAAPTTQTFAFATQRWQNGLALGAGGMALLSVGLFLLSQISTTPALVTQLAILGAVGCISGLALLMKSIRDLLGRLIIDETGIAIRPGFAGFAITWNELQRWEVRAEGDRHPEIPSVRFWIQGEPCALFIPNGWLTDANRDQIRHLLHTHAADRSC